MVSIIPPTRRRACQRTAATPPIPPTRAPGPSEKSPGEPMGGTFCGAHRPPQVSSAALARNTSVSHPPSLTPHPPRVPAAGRTSRPSIHPSHGAGQALAHGVPETTAPTVSERFAGGRVGHGVERRPMARGESHWERGDQRFTPYRLGARHGMRGEKNRGGARPEIGGSRIPRVPTCLCEVHFLGIGIDIVVKSSGKSAKGRGTPRHLMLDSPPPSRNVSGGPI